MSVSAVISETGEVVDASDPSLALPGRVSAIGLELPNGLSFERWLSIGETLKGVERSIMWWIGDWLRYGERAYGETYSQAMEATDYSVGALANAKWVAEKYEPSTRVEDLSWSHHRDAASLAPNERSAVLRAAVEEGWSVARTRAEVNRRKNAIGALPSGDTCTTEDLAALVETGERFGTVYADPPWLYGNQGTRAATGNHYGGMAIEEIAALPIAQLAAENAHLHLWTTNAFLFECPRIMAAWGFEYKSCFVWVKPEMGIGNYWRVSHEFMLFGVRGKAPFVDRGLKSWGEFSRGAHSAKPEKIRALIERASPGPRLELFGRQTVPQWTVWGNQIERNLFRPLAREVA